MFYPILIEVRSCNIAAKSVAGRSVLTIKRLSHPDELINILIRSKGGEPKKNVTYSNLITSMLPDTASS